MTWQIAKVFIAAGVITFSSWLAGKQPRLAGFIMALPISTMLALAFSQAEYGDSAKTVDFAKSVFVAVPLSLLFFVPFLFSGKTDLGFWSLYTLGIILLAGGYFVHSRILG
jgi:predicted membrane channel-forming protein YqfA (hemolysin III family)